ncbi:unnamed protein product [Polarella glacialis]|uniref:ribonuclease H n=1 Tax=Polarella glacialis TaxID=89957 RepID=A0A813KR17_POLGL|nr:unnamed protein product [Polarella glacialis]
MWWSCAAWAHLRIEHCGDLLHEVSAWPECLAVCGLLPAGFCSPPAAVPLFIDLTIEDDTNAPAEIVAATVGLNSSHPVAEICHDNRIVIYTDGACRGTQTRAIRRAGVGVFWGIGHRFNISEPLNGAQQTNQRAELFAVIRALETDDRRLEIRTDSKYVYDGCRANMARWKANEWQIGRRAVGNMDLWQRLDALIVARQPDDICVLKVKGHAKARDILSGATTAQDKAGNDAADELAVAGAAMHAISPEGRRSALQATLLASRVQHTPSPGKATLDAQNCPPDQGPTDKSEKVDMLVSMTCCSALRAEQLLAGSGWDLEKAADAYFRQSNAGPGVAAATGWGARCMERFVLPRLKVSKAP